MVKIKLNPEIFSDYDPETGKSETAKSMLYIIGPTSVSFENAMVPYNSGKYAKRNQSVLSSKHCRGGTLPLWATVEGMWFDDTEFDVVAASEAYPDLIFGVSAKKIIVEQDGVELTPKDLWIKAGGSSGGGGGDIPDANVITW